MHKQSNKYIHPLSDDNINNVVILCSKFIRERYNVSLEDSTLKEILTNIHKKNIQYFQSHPPIPSLEELNKIAISEVRDFIIQKQSSQPSKVSLPKSVTQIPPPPQSPNQSQQQYYNVQHNFKPLPPPQLQQKQSINYSLINNENSILNDNIIPNDTNKIDTELNEQKDYSNHEEKDEDNFFKKLQTLELQRGQKINLNEPAIDPLPPSNQQKIQAAPPQSTNTIIYMSNSSSGIDIRNTKPIVLCGASRMWIHIPDRNILIFNGPLPDSVHIKLLQLMLPKRVSKNTPCINVHITSATDKTIDILCHLDKEGPIWDIWKPISNTLSLIKTFACPWTITLYDLFSKPLEMGKDGNKIINITRLMNGNTKISVEPDIDITSYAQIYIRDQDGNDIHTNILHVLQNTLELPGDSTYLKVNETYICNLQAQPYIIFQIEKHDTEE